MQSENTVATVEVRITVQDENDNQPALNKHRYKELLPNDPVPGTEIVKVRAFDKDSGKNAELKYYIRSGSDGLFKINSK